MAGEADTCSTTSLPRNQVPSGFDHSKDFITFSGYLCKPGSRNVVPGTASNPALVAHACWPMLPWSCKQTMMGSLVAFKLQLNNLSGAPNYRLEAALRKTTNDAAAEREEATLSADTALTAKTPTIWEHVLKPYASQELGSGRAAIACLEIQASFTAFCVCKDKSLGVCLCWGLKNRLKVVLCMTNFMTNKFSSILLAVTCSQSICGVFRMCWAQNISCLCPTNLDCVTWSLGLP